MYKDKYKLSDLSKDKHAIHCKTEKEAERICNMFHEAWMKWSSWASYESHDWYMHEEVTCYTLKWTFYSLDYYQHEWLIIPSTSVYEETETEIESYIQPSKKIHTVDKEYSFKPIPRYNVLDHI